MQVSSNKKEIQLYFVLPALMGEIVCFYLWLIKHKNLSQLAGLTGTPEELKA